MTESEFGAWYERHCAEFPGLPGWIDRLNHDGERLGDRVLAGWENKLIGVSFEAACEASERLAEDPPRSYEDHARRIKQIAGLIDSRRQRSRTFAAFGQETYSCPLCRDGGMVYVFAEGKLLERTARLYGADQAAVATATVFCSCAAGESLKSTGTMKFMAMFNPATHKLATRRYRSASELPDWERQQRLERARTALQQREPAPF